MAQTMVYQWRPKRELPVDPQVVGEELEKLREGDNAVDPAAVIDAARKRSSPLHALFEWNETKAAQAYRLRQAKDLLASIIVTVVRDPSQQEAKDEVSVSVRRSRASNRGGDATASAHVFSAEELAAQRVKKGWRQLEEWVNTFGGLDDFAPIATALSGFLAARGAAKAKAKRVA